ncbi:thrombospondin type 3 repeat-containing protein [Candidatus Parcubacteria bacterium]|nr:thrombospondin type 3 repeat-containing protein [Candidatus Parcubacteria bacterium]
MNYKWLPSKRLILFFGVIIVLIIGIFLIFQIKNKRKVLYNSDNKDLVITQKILIKKASEKDSDNDGLKDWEENLWKTDPNNPDSDGDGTNDNEEILQNRDPLKAGPDDLIQNKTEKEIKYETETEKVAKGVLAGYLFLKQNNSLTDENQEKLLSSIVDNSFFSGKESNDYNLSDLKIISDSKESFEIYKKELLNVLYKYLGQKNDLVVLKKIIDTKNIDDLKLLEESVRRNYQMQKEILNLSVPNQLAVNHLKIVNLIGRIARDINEMTFIFNDPMKALIGIKDYLETEKLIKNEFSEIGNFLRAKGVDIKI